MQRRLTGGMGGLGTRKSIGVDVGSRAVTIAEVQTGGGHPTVTRFGRSLLPLGAVEHGEVHDPVAVAAALTGLWKRLGLTGKAIHVGMANRRVVVRVIEMPGMSPEDLDGAIRYQAQEHIPIPLAEAVMDYEILEETTDIEGNAVVRVLVVAAERAAIDPLIAAVQGANLEPRTLELNAYPLLRCFGGNALTAAEAIIDIGGGVTTVVVHHGGKLRFTRILPNFGGDEFTHAIADSLGVPMEEAETLKRRASDVLRRRAGNPVPAPFTFADEISSEGPALPEGGVLSATPTAASEPHSRVEAAANVIEPLLIRFVNEVRGSVDFYTSQPHTPPLDRIILTGGGALLGGVAEQLRTSLGIPVEFGHPFAHAPIGKVNVSPQEMATAEPFLGVAVGLALAGKG